ncbi:MAG: ATPase domain-containing protein [Methanocellales archaeon]|nr:ATPase domain-containing protein [Methanocellales archaeon]
MFETGIPKLDDYLEGGIPSGKSLIYYTQPGVEGDVFGMQTLYHNLHKGRKGAYVASNSAPYAVKGRFKEFGWGVEKFNQFFTVDCFSALVGADSDERYVVSNPEDIKAVDDALSKAMKNAAGGVIVFESLSTIMDHCGEEETLEYIEKWKKYSKAYDSVLICNFTAWPYAESTLKRLKELFDVVITISGIAERVIFGQYYGVSKADWIAEPKKRSISFKVLCPGGIKIFIPKVLVTGPYHAGKSSFIHAISSRAVSVDRLGTTVAMDHGFIDHKGFTADIFGTPGQERFDPLLRMLSGEAMGVFLLIDSTKPDTFPRAKNMLERTRAHGLPYLVVANKQDLPDALSVDEIRKKMRIPELVPIIPASVTKKKGVLEAFETLIDMITEMR